MDYQAMGMKIRAARKAKEITQEELAEEIGLSASFMGHIERGTRVASLETLEVLCRRLELSADALLGLGHVRREYTTEEKKTIKAFLMDVMP